jgi:hypothetical protein
MTRRIALVCAVIACLLLVAGCGSSSSSNSGSSNTGGSNTGGSNSGSSNTGSSSSAATSSTPASETGSSPSTTSSTSTGSTAVPSSEVKAAVEECKNIISSENKLTSGAKEKLEGACAEAAKGNTAAVTKAAREVCEETIDNSALPTSAKEAAKKDCQKD